jgi:hypothetical protein
MQNDVHILSTYNERISLTSCKYNIKRWNAHEERIEVTDMGSELTGPLVTLSSGLKFIISLPLFPL